MLCGSRSFVSSGVTVHLHHVAYFIFRALLRQVGGVTPGWAVAVRLRTLGECMDIGKLGESLRSAGGTQSGRRGLGTTASVRVVPIALALPCTWHSVTLPHNHSLKPTPLRGAA